MGRLEQLALAVAPRWMISTASRAKAKTRNTLAARRFGPLVDELFPDVTAHELLVANDDAVVMRLEFEDRTSNILKLATSEVASDQLVIEAAALHELGALNALGEWRSKIATVQNQGKHAGGSWFTQSTLPGQATSTVAMDADLLVGTVIAALKPLHHATTVAILADDEVLDGLVTEPLATIEAWRPALADAIRAINGECRQRLAARELLLSRQHGDFAPSNVLWDAHSASISGIVDWKLASRPLPSEIDYVHYALSLLMQRRGAEYGDTVISMLGDAQTSAASSPVRVALDAGPNQFDMRIAVTLTWLQHVSFGLHKAHDLRTNPIWLVNNIDAVVHALHSP